MLKFNYKLTQKSNKKTWNSLNGLNSPISLDKSKIFMISGPNGNGKSFLMHLISSAFFGSHNTEIIESLRQKMDFINNEEIFDLAYSIEIELSNDLSLIASKTVGSSVKVQEIKNGKKGAPIGPDYFNRTYKLIYDIPVDPASRINNIKSNVTKYCSSYSDKLNGTTEKMISLIEKLNHSKDANKIKDLKQNIESLKRGIKTLKSKISDENNKIKLLEKTNDIIYHLNLEKEYRTLRIKRDKAVKKFQSTPEVKNPVTNTQPISDKKLNDFNKKMSSIERSKQECEKIISENNIDNNLNLNDIIIDFKSINPLEICKGKTTDNKYRQTIKHLKNSLVNHKSELVDVSAIDIVHAIDQMIKLIKHDWVEPFNEILPILNFTKDDFLNRLNKIKSDNENKNIDDAFLYDLIQELKDFENYISDGISHYNDYLIAKKKEKNIPDDGGFLKYNNAKTEKEEAEKEFKNCETKFKNSKDKLTRHEINISSDLGALRDNYLFLLKIKSAQIKEENTKCIVEKKRLEAKLEISEKDIARREFELENEEKKESYNYSEYQKQLLRNCKGDLIKIIKYIKTLGSALVNKSNNTDLTPANNYFRNVLGNEIVYGNKGEIKKITNFDIHNDCLTIEDDGQIYFQQLSTGQGMATYLTNKFANPDNKKMIILLDETGTMDLNSRNFVNKQLNKHDEKGNLVFAYFAQVDHKLNELKLEYY